MMNDGNMEFVLLVKGAISENSMPTESPQCLAIFFYRKFSQLPITVISSNNEGVAYGDATTNTLDEIMGIIFPDKPDDPITTITKHIAELWELGSNLASLLDGTDETRTLFENLSCSLDTHKYFHGSIVPDVFDMKFLAVAVVLYKSYEASALTQQMLVFSNLRAAIERFFVNIEIIPNDPKNFSYHDLKPFIDGAKPLGGGKSAFCLMRLMTLKYNDISGYVLKIYTKVDHNDTDIAKHQNECFSLNQLKCFPQIVKLYVCISLETHPVFADNVPEGSSSKFSEIVNKFVASGVPIKSYAEESRRMLRKTDFPLLKKESGISDFRCLIMEHLSKESLEENFRGLDWTSSLHVAEQMSYAVLVGTYNFNQPSVHADLKLENFCLGDDGRVVLIDFADLSLVGTAVPVQSGYYTETGISGVDIHSDVYSLSTCLLRLFTDVKTDGASSAVLPQDRFHSTSVTDVLRPNLIGPDLFLPVANELIDLIFSCCSKNRAGRPQVFQIVDSLTRLKMRYKDSQ